MNKRGCLRYTASLIGLICFLCLLSSCAGGPDPTPLPDGTVEVYYLADWADNETTAELLASRAYQPAGEELISFCLERLFTVPDDEDLRSPFPPDTKPVSHTLEDSLLTLDLPEAFTALTGPDLTMAEACLTLTLCALPDVSALQFTVHGAPWPPQGKSLFTAADFSLDALVLRPVYRTLTLYFVEPGTMKLISEEHLVIIRETELTERYVLKRLSDGPKTAGLFSALPQDAPQPGVSIDKNICYVNFPAAFYEMTPPFTHELTIRAITKSLTSLDDIEAVQFSRDGQNAESYGEVKLDQPVR